MVDTPKVRGPDGVLRQQTLFSTTTPNRFFEGTIDASTVDMQISIRGGAFTSDPDLIVFEGTSFYFPNPSVYPEGLELAPGLNTIEIRAISFSAAVSASAVVEVTLVQESDAGLIGEAPSSIVVEQRARAVEIFAQSPNRIQFTGMNIYASRFQGGGSTGYARINLQIISDYEEIDATTTLKEEQIDTTLATNTSGDLAADPMYVHLTQAEYSTANFVDNPEEIVVQDEEEAAAAFDEIREGLIRTDFTRVIEIPETARTIRLSYNLSSVTTTKIYHFTHNRQYGPASDPPTISIGEFASMSDDEPLYYVVTAMYYDPVQQLEYESPYSTEVVGKPTIVVQTLGTFPAPSQLQIVQNTLAAINRTEPDLAIQPGSVIRDTVVDPISDEIVRMQGLLDFLYRIQSFDTLIQIDGVESDGGSTPVDRSAYKQALARVFYLQNTQDVQTIIDTAFEQLASRNNIFREAGSRSRASVTFFTSKTPTQTISILLGTRVSSGRITFVTTSYAEIPLTELASFFDPASGIYSVDVPVQAESPGSAGNVGAGQIRTLLTSIPGFSVINRARAFGGKDRETNLELAVRARSALASVDTGTEQGILQIAAGLAGVTGALIVAAGDALMQRDWDDLRQKHMGGKVDVWVRGENVGRVTDTFAFSYEIAEDIQFVVFGNPLDLVFRALDKNLSPDHGIREIIDREDIGYGFRNATSGVFFDLTGIKYLDYRTIQLSSDVVQPPVTFGDVLLGDYQYVTTREFVLTRQPVGSVVSVVGQVSGNLPTSGFVLLRPDDPLLEGRSTKSQTALKILPQGGTPNGAFIDVADEDHILFGFYDELLDVLGANPLSLNVYDETKTILYRGPNDPSGVSDYVIVGGSETTAVGIRRTQNSTIRSGQRVLVDYSHSENFTVTYTTNFVIPVAQSVLDTASHVTSDVLVKAVVPVPIDITATIVLQLGQPSSAVDRRIRTNIQTFLRALPQGGALREADVIRLLDQTTGVSYVQLPLTKLTRQEGSLVVREALLVEASGDALILSAYSTPTVRVWLFVNPLSSPTSLGGGPDTNFRGVFQDDQPLELVISSLNVLGQRSGQAFIVGEEGATIEGYSDDATIQKLYPNANTPQEIKAVRQQISQNRVLVSVAVDDQPLNHSYHCTYLVAFVQERVQSIELGPLAVFEPGTLTFTYVEDRR